jgi:hypothetical protein
MFYSKGPEQPPLKDTVRLRECKVFARPMSHSKDPFVFNLATPSRVFFFQASGEVCDAGFSVWVAAHVLPFDFSRAC